MVERMLGDATGVWGPGPLLRAIKSLYDLCRSLVCIASRKSGLLLVSVGLRQGCLLLLVLFIILMDIISMHSQESVCRSPVWGPQDYISAFCR